MVSGPERPFLLLREPSLVFWPQTACLLLREPSCFLALDVVLFALSQLSLCSGLIRPCSCVSLVGLVALKAGLCVSLLMCLLFSLCFVSSSFRSVSSPLFCFFCLPVLVSWILSLIWFPVFLGLQGVVSPVFELVPLLLVPFPCKKKKKKKNIYPPHE